MRLSRHVSKKAAELHRWLWRSGRGLKCRRLRRLFISAQGQQLFHGRFLGTMGQDSVLKQSYVSHGPEKKYVQTWPVHKLPLKVRHTKAATKSDIR